MGRHLRRVEQRGTASVPAALTPLVGRSRERSELASLLADDDVRLVTLLGPGGVGKSRLAEAVALDLESADAVEVVYVACANLRAADDLIGEIGRAANLGDIAGDAIARTLNESFRDVPVVLVLDNLEQIPGAGVAVAALLRACSTLVALATSRSPLRVPGEQRYQVEPLPPADAQRLFLDRARNAGSAAPLDPHDPAIAAICSIVDGLPLALELAAARLRVLSPAALQARLSSQLTVLSGGEERPDRQRTMETAIRWSYDLLAPELQRGHRMLAAIPGTFGAGLAGSVLGIREDEALTVLLDLVDQSLLASGSAGEEARFSMLRAVREFGLEQAREAGELDAARERAVAWYASQSAAIAAGLRGSDAQSWRAWCGREHENLRTAIEWMLASDTPQDALRLSAALAPFWHDSGRYAEGVDLLDRALRFGDRVDADELAGAWNGLASLHHRLNRTDEELAALARAADIWERIGDTARLTVVLNNRALLAKAQGDYETAIDLLGRAISHARANGDLRTQTRAEGNLGTVFASMGQSEQAADWHARALTSARAYGDETMVATAQRRLAMALAAQGHRREAQPHLESAAAAFERLGLRSQLAYCINSLGSLAKENGDIDRSVEQHERALAIWEELEERQGIAIGSWHLGLHAVERGDTARAASWFRRAVEIGHELGLPRLAVYGVQGFVRIALAVDQPERGARLAAAAVAMVERHGFADEAEDLRAAVRRALGKARFDSAWKDGSEMGTADVLAEIEQIAILSTRQVQPAHTRLVEIRPHVSAAPVDHGLTERELEVLRLVASGHTNAQIGEALFISPFTAKTHVANLLSKLGVESRAAASAWAVHHHLV